MTTENLKVTGNVTLTLYGPNNEIKQQVIVPNLVVTAGKNLIANRLAMGTPTSAAVGYMGIGTSSQAAAAADSNLVSPATCTNNTTGRVALTGTYGVATNNQIVYTATFGSGVAADALAGQIQEAGLFNASSGGSMLCRTTFSAINKTIADTLTINWTVTIS